MCNDDDGLPPGSAEVPEKAVQVSCICAIEVTGGLVSQHNGGGIHQGACNRDALLFSSGQFRRTLVDPRREPDGIEEFPCAIADGRELLSADEGRHSNILQSCKFRKQVVKLEDEPYLAVPKTRQLFIGQRKRIHTVEPDGA